MRGRRFERIERVERFNEERDRKPLLNPNPEFIEKLRSVELDDEEREWCKMMGIEEGFLAIVKAAGI